MISLSPTEVAIYYALRMPEIRQRGRRWRGTCPIHRGKHYSFSVDPKTGLWRCWSDCGRGGDIIALEMALTGVSWREGVVEIERIIGRTLLARPANRAERHALAEQREREKVETSDAEHFGTAVRALAEEVLGQLDACDPDRAIYTQLLGVIRTGGMALIDEYRWWRKSDPELTQALVRSGAASQARIQRRLALYIMELANAE
ncbi:MAG: CHC2 zinc finger domain-containing protein [Bryobacteraceae bacterium]|jgi:hypothetical protein